MSDDRRSSRCLAQKFSGQSIQGTFFVARRETGDDASAAFLESDALDKNLLCALEVTEKTKVEANTMKRGMSVGPMRLQ